MNRNHNLISIGKAAKHLGVSVMTLRRWDKKGKLRAHKSSGGHRYYDPEALEKFREDLFSLSWIWASSEMVPEIPEDYYSTTQDLFRARLERMAILASEKEVNSNQVSLITAIAGEIGNNSFDHNLGNWPDVPGIFFAYDLEKRIIVLADRGVGIRATLSRVRPKLKNDIEALRVAMFEQISGRAPEQRGNGLKFILNVVTKNSIGLSLQSGTAIATIKKEEEQLKINLADRNLRGVLAKIEY